MKYYTFILCYFVSTVLHSENSYEKLWELVTYSGEYKQFLYQIEPQIRLINRNDAYEQFLINVSGGVNVTPKLQLWLGQSYANTGTGNAVSEDIAPNSLNEYRNWQQFFWTNAYHANIIALRSRLEERYSFENAPWAMRLRERGYWTIPFTERQSLVLSDELFLNLKLVPWITTKTLDQNRAYIGILENLTPDTSFVISYMNQYIFKRIPENNHAIVLNIFIKIPS